MSATAAKKQKPLKRHPSKLKKMSAYAILTIILISIMAVLFAFPLYWIITGSFKTGAAINATTPEWWPHEWVLTNYQKLFAGKSAPLWQLAVPFGSKFSADGEPIYFSVGPTVPAAIRWMVNTVFMAVMSMILTCITAAMAGYALAKKRFVGRKLLFTLIVCAMALPKQVILIPLLREMSSLNLYNTIWAVIFPIVGWPFGVFLMKQFSEGIPTEMLEAARIDGASEAKTFVSIVLPMVKPGVGALARMVRAEFCVIYKWAVSHKISSISGLFCCGIPIKVGLSVASPFHLYCLALVCGALKIEKNTVAGSPHSGGGFQRGQNLLVAA